MEGEFEVRLASFERGTTRESWVVEKRNSKEGPKNTVAGLPISFEVFKPKGQTCKTKGNGCEKRFVKRERIHFSINNLRPMPLIGWNANTLAIRM